MTSILREAEEIVSGARQEAYGHPLDNWGLTARLMEPILKTSVTAEQAAMCAIAMKVSRLCHSYKRDSVVDIAGYAAVISMIHDERQRRAKEHAKFITLCAECGNPAPIPSIHACGDGS